jgi:hypothetical protein
VKETNYRAYAVAPIILVTFTAIFMMAFYYFQAYQIIATAESKRTTAAAGRTLIRLDTVHMRLVSKSPQPLHSLPYLPNI